MGCVAVLSISQISAVLQELAEEMAEVATDWREDDLEEAEDLRPPESDGKGVTARLHPCPSSALPPQRQSVTV